MNRIGVIAAMEEERISLLEAGIGNVVLSGIGKVNAAVTTAQMIMEDKPDFIVNSGVAGSVSPEVHAGDLVVGTQVAYHDVWCGTGTEMGTVTGQPSRFDADPRLLSATMRMAEGRPGIHFGLLACGDQFYISRREDRRILDLYPEALSCDMESAAIAQTCHRFGVPFICIRAISDEHTSDERQKESYARYWQESRASNFEFLKQIISVFQNNFSEAGKNYLLPE